MDKLFEVLDKEERITFALRALYRQFGYTMYRMSKFEEYDLYVKNKDFLVSENVITFTDTDGRLMALKPDVTLSIIKNAKDLGNGLQKVYYNENVYRVSKGTKSFKEIMQAGLECLGNVTEESIVETLYLAAKSLDEISENNVLEVSNLDIPSGVLEIFGVSEEGKKEIFACLGEKNAQGVKTVCEREKLSKEAQEIAQKLVTVYGAPSKVLDGLEAFKVNGQVEAAVERLKGVIAELDRRGVNKICVDFSVVNDMKYYNGLAFKGFVEGIPTGVLSGGQYDKLMKKMNKNAKEIGFAVYLDGLDRI